MLCSIDLWRFQLLITTLSPVCSNSVKELIKFIFFRICAVLSSCITLELAWFVHCSPMHISWFSWCNVILLLSVSVAENLLFETWTFMKNVFNVLCKILYQKYIGGRSVKERWKNSITERIEKKKIFIIGVQKIPMKKLSIYQLHFDLIKFF